MMRPERAYLSAVGKEFGKRLVRAKRPLKPLSRRFRADNPHPQYVAWAQKFFDCVFKITGKLPRRRAKRLAYVPCVKREARRGARFVLGEPAVGAQTAQKRVLPSWKGRVRPHAVVVHAHNL